MIALRFAPRARSDIDRIWTHTVQSWSEAQAEAYLLAIDQAIDLLRENPRLGRRTDDIANGLLKYPVASHVIYYRVTPGALNIVRVLHKSMDAERHLQR